MFLQLVRNSWVWGGGLVVAGVTCGSMTMGVGPFARPANDSAAVSSSESRPWWGLFSEASQTQTSSGSPEAGDNPALIDSELNLTDIEQSEPPIEEGRNVAPPVLARGDDSSITLQPPEPLPETMADERLPAVQRPARRVKDKEVGWADFLTDDTEFPRPRDRVRSAAASDASGTAPTTAQPPVVVRRGQAARSESADNRETNEERDGGQSTGTDSESFGKPPEELPPQSRRQGASRLPSLEPVPERVADRAITLAGGSDVAVPEKLPTATIEEIAAGEPLPRMPRVTPARKSTSPQSNSGTAWIDPMPVIRPLPRLAGSVATESQQQAIRLAADTAIEKPAEPDQLEETSADRPEVTGPVADVLSRFDQQVEAGELLAAHKELSKWYWAHREDRAVIEPRLGESAERIFFSKQPHFVEPYVVGAGDQLRKVAGKYQLSWQYLSRLNNVDPKRIQVGQKLKVLKGPFSAIVELSQFSLIVHLQGYYVKRYTVGIGRDQGTPLGKFSVLNKVENPQYTDPDGRVISGDDPQNPLGERWIDLGGSYGIHGTIEPDSIGRAESRGCIRMLDADVREVYDFLVDGSEVEIRK